jgi:oligo-1,6-glucosidase
MVSRFGDDGAYRRESAKLIAGVVYLLQGTPFLYQGEELGMTNPAFESVDSYRDIETINFYREQQEAGVPSAEIMRLIHAASRDNGRTPFQWNGDPGAGFTRGTPWIPVNPNHTEINLADQWDDEQSVVSFYRRLISLRKESEAALYREFELDEDAASPLFVYRRRADEETLTVLANWSSGDMRVEPPDTDGEVVLASYPDPPHRPARLRPWELLVLRARR